MVIRQPQIELGKIQSAGSLSQVTIGGQSTPFKNVVAPQNFNQGDNVLLLFVNDDIPVVIGAGGYRTPQ